MVPLSWRSGTSHRPLLQQGHQSSPPSLHWPHLGWIIGSLAVGRSETTMKTSISDLELTNASGTGVCRGSKAPCLCFGSSASPLLRPESVCGTIGAACTRTDPAIHGQKQAAARRHQASVPHPGRPGGGVPGIFLSLLRWQGSRTGSGMHTAGGDGSCGARECRIWVALRTHGA